MQPQQPQYKPQPHQPVGTPTHLSHPNENYTAPELGQSDQPATAPQHDYSFLTQPADPFAKQGLRMSLGGAPLIGKLVVGVGAIFVLGILFVLVKGLLGGGSGLNTAVLMSVAEDQQELIHLTAGINQKPQGLATTTLNSAITIQVSVGDSQRKIIGYLQTNKHKVNIKQLNLKVSSALDTQMASAAANGTFDQTYQSVLQSQLNIYSNDLKTAYAADKGAKGRALLTADFNAAQLLIQQLNSPAS